MSAARIGKIRLKAGGAEVRVLHQAVREDGENYKGELVKDARLIADDPQDMVGYVVVALFADGTYNRSWRLDADAAIGRTMLPAYVAEVIRSDVLTRPIADGEI